MSDQSNPYRYTSPRDVQESPSLRWEDMAQPLLMLVVGPMGCWPGLHTLMTNGAELFEPMELLRFRPFAFIVFLTVTGGLLFLLHLSALLRGRPCDRTGISVGVGFAAATAAGVWLWIT